MTDTEARTKLMLSIQRALLGEVTERMQSVTCGVHDQRIEIKAYFRGKVTPDDIERIQNVGTEVIADFSDEYRIHESCASLSEEPEQVLDFWAFSRAT
jgi:hypothetical protein